MSYSVIHCNTTQHFSDFLAVPKMLYAAGGITQNINEEKALLMNKHPLSHYFTLDAFLLYDDDRPVARVALFEYANDARGYVGFYECIDDDLASSTLLDAVAAYAKDHKKESLFGPYDASFWMHYRMKLDRFDEPPYMGEPSNLSYYPRQFRANGFTQTLSYVSSEYGLALNPKKASEFTDATQRAKRMKYQIKSPKPSEFMATLEQCYMFFSTLYADFPGYKPITKQEFIELFRTLQPLLNYHFVKFAYDGDKVVGFVIGFPDYGNLPYRPMTRLNKLRIMLRKIRAQRYIVMYLGVLPEHSGLGRALVRPLAVAAFLRGSKVMGALAKEDKVTASYGQELIRKQYRYGMFERAL